MGENTPTHCYDSTTDTTDCSVVVAAINRQLRDAQCKCRKDSSLCSVGPTVLQVKRPDRWWTVRDDVWLEVHIDRSDVYNSGKYGGIYTTERVGGKVYNRYAKW
jgi:hypothetical protein